MTTAYNQPVIFPGDGRPTIAEWVFPLGNNTAALIIRGAGLTDRDFESLTEFVNFCRDQYLARATPPKAP